MSLPIQKTVVTPDHISLLCVTRERPERVKCMLDSLEENTADKEAIDVWFYVDDDDVVTREQVDRGTYEGYSFGTRWQFLPGGKTQGQMINALAERCDSGAGIFMPCPDDYCFVTPRWDAVVRDCFHQHADRLVLAFPDDPTAKPDQLTFIITSAEWVNAVGRLMPGHFPYWYEDVWTSQVGLMAQRRVKAGIRMEPQGGRGKTGHMRNILFWHKFYLSTADDRFVDAAKVIAAVHPNDSAEREQAMAAATTLGRQYHAEDCSKPIIDVVDMERELSSIDPMSRPKAAYLAMEAQAVAHLRLKIWPLLRRGHAVKALGVIDTILCSYQYCKRLQYARARAGGAMHRFLCRVGRKVAALARG